MTLLWTAPRTWAAGETLTAALLNTHVRDNLSYLLRPNQSVVRQTSGTIVGSPTTYAPVGAAFSYTFEAAGGHILVTASGHILVSSSLNGHTFSFAFQIDGGTPVVVWQTGNFIGGVQTSFHFSHIFANVAAGNHPLAFVWKVTNTGMSGTIETGSIPLQFSAIEV